MFSEVSCYQALASLAENGVFQAKGGLGWKYAILRGSVVKILRFIQQTLRFSMLRLPLRKSRAVMRFLPDS